MYLARDLASGRSVAVKLLGTSHAGNTEAAHRFAREARTVAALDHPHIVRTLAIEELSGSAIAIVSEYIPGHTLRALLRESGPLPFEHAAGLLRDVASALAYAHGFRIVHRDVKPENIFVEAETGRALLADFGIARPLDSDTLLTAAGSSLGTPSYMAPEQVKGGQLDERADVYSLGLVGWEMLTGSRPWEGETLYEVLHKQQHERLPSLADLRPDIPTFLLSAIEGAHAKLPSERWSNGAEFLARLTPTPTTLPQRRTPVGSSAVGDATVALPSLTVAFERSSAASEAREDRPVDSTWSATPPHDAAGLLAGTSAETTEDASAGTSTPTPVVTRTPREAPASDVQEEPGEPVRTEHDRFVANPEHPEPVPAVRARRRMRVAGPLLALLAAALFAWWVLNGNQVRLPADAPSVSFPSPAGSTRPREVALQETTRTRRPDASPVSAPVPAAPAKPSAPVARPPARPTPRAPVPRVATQPQRTTRAAPARTPAPAPAVDADDRCSAPTTTAQRACLIAGIDRNDVALTRTYQALIAHMRREAGGTREPPAVRALRVEQRAWIVQRDRACRPTSEASGSLWGAERVPCFARMSDARDDVLQKRLQERTGRD